MPIFPTNHQEAEADRTLTKVKNLGLAEELGGSSIGWPLKALDKVRDWTTQIWGFPKIRGTFLGSPQQGLQYFGGLYWGAVFGETRIY